MTYMWCWNRVKDYEIWLKIFQSHVSARQKAGIHLEKIYKSVDDPADVYFLLRVEDRTRAEAFVARPENVAAGEEAGVISGEIIYLEEI